MQRMQQSLTVWLTQTILTHNDLEDSECTLSEQD